MSQFYKKLSSQIADNKDFTLACDELFQAYIYTIANEEYVLNDKIAKKLATAIQFFYLSEDEDYINEGATLLSMLLHVSNDNIGEIVAIADSVFTQTGDFPNAQLLKDRFPGVKCRVSIFDETKKDLRKELNTVNEIDHPLTDYQRTLWEDLASDHDVITSAPTSTGKTHLILQYLMQKVIESDGAFAAVVVPTRALISELAGKIHEIAKGKEHEKNIGICTVPSEGPFKEKTFFVMTQERLFEVLQAGDLYFDYLFVDEAHNISDKSRGVLLHMTLQKILEGSNPQIVVSMPSQRYQNAFDSVFDGVEFEKKKTKHSPVAKIIMPVSFKGKNIHISRIGSDRKISIPKGFKDKKLQDVVCRLGQGESNIIYRNQTNYCEHTASGLAALLAEREGSQRLEEAADYVERFLHEDFSLASCLRKGVAFHYGPLPGAVRTMVEALAREGEVDFIVCTSTLAEGVNLPAKNLFLTNPTQQTPRGEPSARLEDVKLDNITGRAGRMLEHFAGNIFLIEQHEWAYQDYFDEREEIADQIPTYFKVLNDNLDDVLEALDGKYDHTSDNQFSYYTIANKLLKEFDGEILSTTLDAPELKLDAAGKQRLEKHIVQAYDALKVDTFTLEANPTVGFIQQNKLYNSIQKQDDLADWMLPHPMSPELYPKLVFVCNELFEAGIFLPKEAYSIEHACVIAAKWMRGDSLKKMIIEQIKTDKKNDNFTSCDSSVRSVIKVVNTDVRFRMSSALRCYHALITDILGEKASDLSQVKLYSYIEVGGCEDRVISLVNLGLSRETALEIHRVLPRDVVASSFETLRRLFGKGRLDTLHVVTMREIEDLIS